VIPNSLEFDRGTVVASKLIVSNYESRNHHAVPEPYWDRIESEAQQKTFQRYPFSRDQKKENHQTSGKPTDAENIEHSIGG
jgi:hypothetical protein